MRNIRFNDGYLGPRLPKEVQLHRVRQVIEEELSPIQRQTLIDYYFHLRSIPQIARDRGVHKSTVFRALRRAEANLHKHLKY